MKKMKKAFTLAEVLITLAIIGVVSALTIPVLVQKTNKQEYVSALQKAYSVLSQAANMIIAENGSPKGEEGWADSNVHIYNLFKEHLSNVKECSEGTGCWEQLGNTARRGTKALTGGRNDHNWNFDGGYLSLIFADGMQAAFVGANKNCNSSDLSSYGSKDFCGRIYLDVNGVKEPNQWGRDIFFFVLKENGLYPAGCDAEVIPCAGTNGIGCACKVLREGKMDY